MGVVLIECMVFCIDEDMITKYQYLIWIFHHPSLSFCLILNRYMPSCSTDTSSFAMPGFSTLCSIIFFIYGLCFDYACYHYMAKYLSCFNPILL
jgi:hypothetical protein